KMRGPTSKIVLSNEGIRFQTTGIAPALSNYLGETTNVIVHSLEDILYNIVCIYRTYCLSYPRMREIFLPLQEAAFVRDSNSGAVYLRALAATDIDWQSFQRALPASFRPLPGSMKGVLSASSVNWTTKTNPAPAEMHVLRLLHESLRACLHYINGA